MKLFYCDTCGHPVFFDNASCLNCGCLLGFDSKNLHMLSLDPGDTGTYHSRHLSLEFRYCENQRLGVCNWIIPVDHSDTFCRACELNRVIPNLSQPSYWKRWKAIEEAKHRLVYTLLNWQLPLLSKHRDPKRGLVFDFKSNSGQDISQPVVTGHAQGIITLNIAEADDVEREMMRNEMDEVYRTLLGHFRHEIGHYYWDLLVKESDHLHGFRTLFGDETQNYASALERHYQVGPLPDWRETYISAYATMHPWEDWAETWAHYLHIVDTLETAYSFGTQVHPRSVQTSKWLRSDVDENAYFCEDFNKIIAMWMPLSIALNSINRSMGASDLYPFVINPSVIRKLEFVHGVIRSESRRQV
ncbi:MAG: putative zinc-binding peptidase [Lunatimonas sp.]|uniref:zinc-binding metallopeptidase family protein n=1 Tax=Lunatimonas sp. TaxID=2060141 RepID=UPI00263A47D0|nr:putative zinc-binding peptidase [Lunatimonas sp.]MCC5937452.1 putative zinc-binding peptidase [Lunatimonas sp.]